MQLPNEHKADLLREIPLFAGCSAQELPAVADAAEDRSCPTIAGKVLTPVVQRLPYDTDV